MDIIHTHTIDFSPPILIQVFRALMCDDHVSCIAILLILANHIPPSLSFFCQEPMAWIMGYAAWSRVIGLRLYREEQMLLRVVGDYYLPLIVVYAW